MSLNFIIANYLFLVSIFSIILGIYFSSFFHRNQLLKVLATFLIVGGVKIVSHVTLMLPQLYTPEWLLRICSTIPLLFGPFMYLFIRMVTGGETVSKKDYVHFYPFIIYGMVQIPRLLSSDPESFYFVDYSIEKAIVVLCTFVQGIGYLVASFRTFEREEKRLKQKNSEIETLNHSWLRLILIIQLILWSVAIGAYLIAGSGLNIGFHVDTIIFSTASIWIIAVAMLRFKQPQIFRNEPFVLTTDSPYEKSELSDSVLEEIHEKLLVLMEEEQLFLTPRLSLTSLADRNGYSVHNISQVINRQNQSNFYDFVNYYRLEHAQKLLRDSNCDFTIVQIAEESGFNSKSTFNTLFKKRLGVTPSHFRLNKN